jgi:hypothetical protein
MDPMQAMGQQPIPQGQPQAPQMDQATLMQLLQMILGGQGMPQGQPMPPQGMPQGGPDPRIAQMLMQG